MTMQHPKFVIASEAKQSPAVEVAQPRKLEIAASPWIKSGAPRNDNVFCIADRESN
ncbi:hypothetical protein [Sphingopyxis sp. FD7]|jgi:hypothetical protein|uniref:hypothetical protein n=1 Tax=Sphingopyxis sp. FD7 TaxID=1914525 RepID=UPI001559304E|nr:hypothetical protein [Sphingopyxis sp. FD7]